MELINKYFDNLFLELKNNGKFAYVKFLFPLLSCIPQLKMIKPFPASINSNKGYSNELQTK